MVVSNRVCTRWDVARTSLVPTPVRRSVHLPLQRAPDGHGATRAACSARPPPGTRAAGSALTGPAEAEMTKQESFKKRIRARMQETGERYNADRRALIEQAERRKGATDATDATDGGRTWVAEPDLSDEVIAEATGRGWDALVPAHDPQRARARTALCDGEGLISDRDALARVTPDRATARGGYTELAEDVQCSLWSRSKPSRSRSRVNSNSRSGSHPRPRSDAVAISARCGCVSARWLMAN